LEVKITRIIERRIAAEISALLEHTPAVALIGPRQAGKTTLALAVAEGRPSVYLDLESEADRARLTEPALYFTDHVDELVILDEIHRTPGLFEALRGVIDQGRRDTGPTAGFCCWAPPRSSCSRSPERVSPAGLPSLNRPRSTSPSSGQAA
jgi:predicted AAA+ superfamily ATPase